MASCPGQREHKKQSPSTDALFFCRSKAGLLLKEENPLPLSLMEMGVAELLAHLFSSVSVW